MTAVGLFLALAVGLSLGLLGGGGSVLTVPIFKYVLGFDAKPAIAMSLIVVGALSLIGAARHWRAGRVDFRVAAIMGGIAIPASYVAARLAAFISGPVQLTMFAIVVIVAAISMLRPRKEDDTPAAPAHLLRMFPAALGVGALTGLIGVGGGFLIVPTLVLFGGVPTKVAIGTSLLVIAANCAAGFAGYVGQVMIPWPAVGEFTAIAAIGIFGGAYLCDFISAARLRRGFAVLLLGVGIAVFAQGGRKLKSVPPAKAVAADTIDPSAIPPDSAIPNDSIGASIRRGMAIVAHTPDSLPHNTPTTLRCTSCHLDGGRRAGVVSMLGSYARYPRFVVRENRTASIEDRVNFCLTRSLAGQPLPADSRDMRDMVRYLAYLSTGVKKGDWVRGEGLPNPLPPMAADTARGARVFAANCTRCHGVNGEGSAPYPALWGPHSYDIGASMARLQVAATFIRRGMPYDRPGTLTDQEAYDVAAFVLSHPRPDFPGKSNDWPLGDAPGDVPYVTKNHTPTQPMPALLPHEIE
ncbi:MAG TPA: TSUP family transporter [Gemmatimonadaceae bacterium]|nr:TSUP family transporter [Gemmatimonadaceae bacterium]